MILRIVILRSVAGINWHVQENEILDVPEVMAQELIKQGIAELDGPRAAAVRPTRSMSKKMPQFTSKE